MRSQRDIAGTRISLIDVGDGPRTIVALHGFGSDASTSFGPLAERMAAGGYRFIAPDLPGFGRSTRLDPADGRPFSLQNYASFTAALASSLAPGARVALVGHSMGAKIALTAAVQGSETVASVALINPGGFSAGERLLARFGHFPFWYDLLETAPVQRLAHRLGLRAFVSTEEARNRLRDFRTAHRHMDLDATGVRRALRELRQPVVVVWGVDDRMLPRSTPAAVTRSIPRSEVHYIPNAGHAAMVDQPDLVAHALHAFVEVSRAP